MQLTYAQYTSPGGRANNEDAFLAVADGENRLFAVADGLGGHQGGEIASALAVGVLERLFSTKGEDFDLNQALLAADAAILQKQRETGLKMKTTLSAVLLQERAALAVNVGDSRIYAFQKGKMIFQSLDHSAAQLAVMAGEIAPGQLRGHEDRNRLTRVLGASDSLRGDFSVLGSWDSLLLCSDGFWEYEIGRAHVWEYVLEEEMEQALARSTGPEGWLARMRTIHTKRAPSNHDNHTAVAVIAGRNKGEMP